MVISGTAIEEVVAVATIQVVPARLAEQLIVAISTIEGVTVIAPLEKIVARSALYAGQGLGIGRIGQYQAAAH
ncbi:hypothetical protein D3C78_1740990 [compost metagenome]